MARINLLATPNDKIVMAKNENYYDVDNVKIDTINWIPFEDRSACLRRFEAKEVQICSEVPTEQMDYIQKNVGDALKIAPYLGTYYLPVKGKSDDSKLKDPRIRQVISLVIDREFLAEEIWRGTMIPASSLVPPGISSYVKDVPTLGYSDDLIEREDKAKADLRAGEVNGPSSPPFGKRRP